MVVTVDIEFPISVLNAAEHAANRHKNDITAAVEMAKTAVRRLPNLQSIVDALLDYSMKHLVYDFRHKANVKLKRELGTYHTTPKVGTTSLAIREAYQSAYDYYIAGTTIGELKGDQLDDIISSEEERSKGHTVNVRVLSWLKSQGVTGDKKVRNVVSERKLRNCMKRVREEIFGTETVAV